jgi:hypothetical protein
MLVLELPVSSIWLIRSLVSQLLVIHRHLLNKASEECVFGTAIAQQLDSQVAKWNLSGA